MRSLGGASDDAKADRMVARARKRQEKAEMAREEAKARRDALVAALEDKVRMIDRGSLHMQTRLCAANHFEFPSLFMIDLARIGLCEPSRMRCSRSWPARRFASKLCL
jgi:hypothetical protein